LAALCYAEFAALAPVAGSAYTYAYATLGEGFAWIIGWDLILEYAIGCATVASGWSANFDELLNAALGLRGSTAVATGPVRGAGGEVQPSRRPRHGGGDRGAGHGHSRERGAQYRPRPREGRRRGVRRDRGLGLRQLGELVRRPGRAARRTGGPDAEVGALGAL